MFWITKYRHNKIVAEYKEALEISKQNINRKEKFEEITEKLTDIADRLTDKFDGVIASIDGCIAEGNLILPNDVARYVDDYYGGQVLKQEATKLVVIDKDGNATYHWTAKKPTGGYSYRYELLK